MDYKNGKIYQILNNVNDDIYVGSTCQALSKRMYQHRSTCNNSYDAKAKLYQLMREIGQDNFYIELIETYPCNSKEELNAKEGYYIRERATLNMAIAGRKPKQYKEENKEHIKQTNKQYRENNKEHILEKQKNIMKKPKKNGMNTIRFGTKKQRTPDGTNNMCCMWMSFIQRPYVKTY